MRRNHPNILVDFVPAGCTPLWQPCDVGIQRILKHAIKQRCHQDIVNETLRQLNEEVAPKDVILDIKLGVLRDRSVRWLWEAYGELQDKEIVSRVRVFLTVYTHS
jgi:hypothetical protein